MLIPPITLPLIPRPLRTGLTRTGPRGENLPHINLPIISGRNRTGQNAMAAKLGDLARDQEAPRLENLTAETIALNEETEPQERWGEMTSRRKCEPILLRG